MGSAVTIKDMMTSEEFIFINISPPMTAQVYGGSNGEDTIPVLKVNIDSKSKLFL